MTRLNVKTNPVWLESRPPMEFPRLEADAHADVLVVGGGITGLTAAYLLGQAGRSVMVVERDTIGGGETGHTTAHVTYVTDTRLPELEKRFGRDHAQAVWDAGASAMAEIQAIVQREAIDCELRQVPAFLVAAEDKDLQKEAANLRQEARLATQLGFDARFVDAAPVFGRPAMRVSNQLKFHPIKYLSGLAQAITRQGGRIFEHTEATEFEEGPRRAKAGGHTIHFDRVIFATHVPVQGLRSPWSAALLQTKLAVYSTYAIGASIPKGLVPEMMWWDTGDPYLYLRVERGTERDYVILGGEDHKTGQEADTELPFRNLVTDLRYLVPEAVPELRWSARVIETVDGLPYIGEVGDGQFVATGFSGNGMTYGTLGGMMACDAIAGIKNPWQDLFSVDRKKLSAAWDYVAENKDYPYYLVKGRLGHAKPCDVENLKAGAGCVVSMEGEKVAAYRDDAGLVHLRSAVCPHLGCIVTWNEAEKTWDCPCHGSRFHANGEVMGGPAESALAPHPQTSR
jgi:glycine/D-amino acid oxidase-like deaminating enzyme/nitrite reductase/ring-hydroxylating ferredoxin subunit